jgi:hypothetical protein
MRMVMASIVSLLWLGAASAAEAIATTDGEAPGMRLEVRELKVVSGGAVMFRYTIVNDSDKEFDLNTALKDNDSSPDWHVADGVYLVDVSGKKKYMVVRDSEKHCLCSRDIQNLKPNSSANFWAKFPAPPDGVQKIGVVVPHFVPMDDVPLAR